MALAIWDERSGDSSTTVTLISTVSKGAEALTLLANFSAEISSFNELLTIGKHQNLEKENFSTQTNINKVEIYKGNVKSEN